MSSDTAEDKAASQSLTLTTPLDLPSVEQVLSGFPELPTSLPNRGDVEIELEEQLELFQTLRNSIETEAGDSRDVQSLQSVYSTLQKLWACNSQLLNQATEVLANGSRDSSWRILFGQSGILNFFLEVISSRKQVDSSLLLHALRLVGNSCADTDENREIVVSGKYTSTIVRHFLNPDLIQVAIPVIYNICMDYEPAHSQMAENRTAYIILKLLNDNVIQESSGLFSFSYDLVELASEQAQGVENSPDGIVLQLIELALNEDTTFEHYSTLVGCLAMYLEKERFQTACVTNALVEKMLSILQRSFSFKIDPSSKEDTQALAQSRLKINQGLAEISASPLFAEYYPLDSAIAQTLKNWIVANEDQLQICACVILGNLARSDEVCEVMVRKLKIHEELISVLKGQARGAVLHSALGFLKNLAIAGDNRVSLAKAGIIPAVAHLWTYESVPQVQFSAASIVRQVTIASIDNISLLLAPLSGDVDSPDHKRTYLSLLLSLFEKTDSAPIKTEIGRTVASICRTVSPKARDGDEHAALLLGRLYSLHEDVARPVGEMITQTQWPVVRSEGWFALALMATNKAGCVAVADCLKNEEVMGLLKTTIRGETPSGDEVKEDKEKDLVQITKDRDNAFVLAQELLKNESGALSEDDRSNIEDLTKDHLSCHFQNTLI
ncbi:Armadillo-like helical [Penicillium taxi]|uniref:Armadillo-like helical n=1 Tax=Penicillium taxi TaxID=168475 RepID=UPI002545B5C9|nr:Armadillo-like helical [Penicillium taxi]KAJ5895421.1 Armadillo-like helical [Penicillium taxi]